MVLNSKYSEYFEEWFRKELYYCYLEARKNKRSTYDEHNFEMFAMENLDSLVRSVMTEEYWPGEGIAFVSTKPVYREIFAAKFRDRIIHHFIFDSVAEWWDKRLIYDSYSCRKGKGTLFGIQRAAKMMASATEGFTKEAYMCKFDYTGFFMHLKKDLLFEKVVWGLNQQMDPKSELYRVNKYLWGKTIFDTPTLKATKRGDLSLWSKIPDAKSLFKQPLWQGVVIGNLSSQLSSNIYLDDFDRLIKYQLGYRYYGRYVDDFFLIMTPEELRRFLDVDLPAIKDYVMGMGLSLHPNKVYIQPVSHGMEFLGAKIYPHHIQLGKRIVKNARGIIRDFAQDKATLDQMTSILGMAKNYDSLKLLTKLFEEMGWEYLI